MEKMLDYVQNTEDDVAGTPSMAVYLYKARSCRNLNINDSYSQLEHGLQDSSA